MYALVVAIVHVVDLFLAKLPVWFLVESNIMSLQAVKKTTLLCLTQETYSSLLPKCTQACATVTHSALPR